MFLGDRWPGTSRHICRDIRKYIADHPIAPPTQLFGELYETENVQAMRRIFESLLRKPVAYMVYAPPGSQKSFTIEALVGELNRQEMARNGSGRRAYYMYATVRMTPAQVMRAVAIACGIPSGGDVLRIARNLAFEFQCRRVVLAVDEAQHLSIDSLEALRALLDRPPNFSLLLAGSHDLHGTFDRLSSLLGQWNSRIIQKVKLPGVSVGEAEGIIEREVSEQLKAMTPEKRRKKIQLLIETCTTTDAFEEGCRYINIRTLVNSLDQIKMR